MSVDVRRVAAALRFLADAVEDTPTTGESRPVVAAASLAAEGAPKPRGRGRPPKGGDDTPAAPTQSPAVEEADPFATTAPAAPSAPVATLEEVRAALTALKAAASQEIALAVLKTAGGADNLPTLAVEKYGLVVQAAKAKQAEYTKAPAPVEPDDPFEVPAAATVVEKLPSIEEVKTVVVETQKRTSTDAAQRVVMQFGGEAVDPEGGGKKPSLKALPPKNYVACIAALKALPGTK